ncbi:MAG: response regulator, partial [Ktedonobacteraceae bacterium]
DLMMPTMDGPTFMTELERCGLRPSIPVIVLTANIYARPLIESMRVDSYLCKPFRLAELLQQIRSLVAKYHNETFTND